MNVTASQSQCAVMYTAAINIFNRMVSLASRRSRMQIVTTAMTIMCALTAMTER